MCGFRGQARRTNYLTDELLRQVGVNETGLPGAQDFSHFFWAEMFMGVFRIVRPEQVGELLARVLGKITDGLQTRQDNQIPIVNFLPQFRCGCVQIDVHGHTDPPLSRVGCHSADELSGVSRI